jgi:hypothetical protein
VSLGFAGACSPVRKAHPFDGFDELTAGRLRMTLRVVPFRPEPDAAPPRSENQSKNGRLIGQAERPNMTPWAAIPCGQEAQIDPYSRLGECCRLTKRTMRMVSWFSSGLDWAKFDQKSQSLRYISSGWGEAPPGFWVGDDDFRRQCARNQCKRVGDNAPHQCQSIGSRAADTVSRGAGNNVGGRRLQCPACQSHRGRISIWSS